MLRQCRQAVVHYIADFGWGYTGEQFIEGGAKGVDVGRRGEGAYAALLVLLQGGIAMADADGGGTGL